MIACLLVSMITSQLIPVEGIREMLPDSQALEEILHSAETDGKTTDGNEGLKKDDLYFQSHSANLYTSLPGELIKNKLYRNYASRPADDTPTPPPLIVVLAA